MCYENAANAGTKTGTFVQIYFPTFSVHLYIMTKMLKTYISSTKLCKSLKRNNEQDLEKTVNKLACVGELVSPIPSLDFRSVGSKFRMEHNEKC